MLYVQPVYKAFWNVSFTGFVFELLRIGRCCPLVEAE